MSSCQTATAARHQRPHGTAATAFNVAGCRAWLILAGSLAIALAVYYGYLGSGFADHVAAWTAYWTNSALNALGTSTRVDGTIIRSDSFAINIVAECTAVGPIILFVGAVAAYPARFRAKGIGVALGLVILTLVNVVRIVSLFWVGAAYPQYLDVAHLLVWQSAIILLAIVLWLVWVDRFAHAGHR